MKKKQRQRRKQKPKLAVWLPWQMELKGHSPFYLHAHLCSKTCDYKCNGSLGFLIPHLVMHSEDSPLLLGANRNGYLKSGQQKRLVGRLVEVLLMVLAKVGARLTRTMALRMGG